jgi:ABC-2 type transport system ATP-binding protein
MNINPIAIETIGLGKDYGRVRAVENLSLRVNEGEIYAFLGLNGAGKTTTIRMLLGMIRPTRGQASVLGTRVRPGIRAPWGLTGYLVETPHAYPELTVVENLEAARRLHPGTPQSAMKETIERLGLAQYADRRAGTLSQGNAQRLGLAKALLHGPKLLLLDEPANGLDPAGIVEIRELLLDLVRSQGVTVFMSSHILAEVARLADRVAIIHQGRLLRELSRPELERERGRRLLLRTPQVTTAVELLAAAGHAGKVLIDGSIETRGAAAVEHPEEINQALVQAGIPVTRLLVEEEELEDYFLRLVGIEGGKHNG